MGCEQRNGKDDRGEYEWEECRECDGRGFVYEHGFRESCLNGCHRGMVKVYGDEYDDYEEPETGTPHLDDSALCEPARIDDANDEIPW